MEKAKCVDDSASFNALTNGASYEVIETGSTYVRVKSNRGERTFSRDRFEVKK